MSKIYDDSFKIGFLFNIFVFVVLNIISASIAYNEYINQEIKFAHGGYSWGFPFEMFDNYSGYPQNNIGFTPVGLVLNTISLVISGYCFGFLSKFIRSKISSHCAELK